MNYTKIIKEIRQKKIISQMELADLLDVSFNSVNRWENGAYEPTIKAKRKLIEIFNNLKTDKKLLEDYTFLNCDYKKAVKCLKNLNVQVDAIITDPPYGVSRKTQLGFSNMGRSGMNYGEWDYNFNQKEWIRDCEPLIKKGGSIIIFNDWKNLSYIVEELEKLGFFIKDLIRWEKNNPMPRNVNSRYVSDFEVAIWAVKGNKGWTFNKPTDLPYLRPVYCGSLVAGSKNRIHPTQKNELIIQNIIKVHTNENDLIFDPFAGSGTTIHACIKTNRRAIGTEIDTKYYEKAKERFKYVNISFELCG